MPSTSPAAAAAARRLLAAADVRAAGAPPGLDPSAGDAAVAAGRAAADLADALARWFGPYGTHALLARALGRARADHPALAPVRLGAPPAPVLDGLADAARAHGADAVTEGVAALLAGAVGLLGRMIGEDMALQLVERRMDGLASVPPPRAPDQPPGAGPTTPAAPRTGPAVGGGA